MGESELHQLLKKVGVAYLHNQGCSMAAMEVGVVRDRGIEKHELDNHHIMDVVGLSKKYIPYGQRGPNFNYLKDDYYQHVLRGIEVKVSRADFKNGFCCTGCNYHYLLTPMRLVNPADLPKWVGLLEYNKHKFKASYGYDGFNLEGLRVVKKPRFREITERQLQKTIVTIGTRLHYSMIVFLADDLKSSALKTKQVKKNVT